MKIAIAISHGHTPKWTQVLIHSIKQNRNNEGADIYIACTWPGHPSIRAITETELGDGVTVLDCKRRLYSHATGLEEILEHIAWKGYTHLFCTETDCRALKSGWLDWFASQVQDDAVGIAGFFWEEGRNHYNINPSATIYRVDMLLKYHTEVRANRSGIFYHPNGNKKDDEPGMDPSIKNVAGVFSETRGIANPTPEQMDKIQRGVPNPAWWEPGQWCYARLQGEWKEVRVACDHIYMPLNGHTTPEGTYYGGKRDGVFVHYWGGTRCYDFLKHPVECNFVRSCAPEWIRRENRIWCETVPEHIRAKVHEINKSYDLEGIMRKNLGTFVPEVM